MKPCKYEGDMQDKASPPLFACRRCGHLTTRPGAFKEQFCPATENTDSNDTTEVQ